MLKPATVAFVLSLGPWLASDASSAGFPHNPQASENYGNFYGQNLSPVQAGVLLVYSTLTNLGCSVNLWAIVWSAIPMVLLSLVAAAAQFLWYDRNRFAQPKAEG